MQRIKNTNAVLTGIFLILVALLAFYLSWPLSGNTNEGLGPGYVPRMFAGIQLLFGAALIVSGVIQSATSEAADPWHTRPLVLVLASVAYFAITIEKLGLVIAVIGLVLIGCAANRGTTFKESAALAVGSAVFSALVFVKLLGLSIALWP